MARRRGRSSQLSNENTLVGIADQSNHLGRYERIFDDDEVLSLLKAAVEREGHQVAFARRHGFNRAYLNMILNGKRSVSDKIIKALGLRKVYVAED